ncbi:helix-turn-helix domain-containing protein [Curvibacter sp. CHRR-16]|uniref:AraC family transcriptional regulator n=1 Tax=Curvibacter sp. CHRR-16 TaxID=2835872 RepID=UPI001BDAFBAA|nr:helix-turn-helix domain-containing protein [Curvibacter sp. CHRR-16]MBT0569631.1 helix-turn-helix domain-containing protein [Curvibacter sp. CHRR-16]
MPSRLNEPTDRLVPLEVGWAPNHSTAWDFAITVGQYLQQSAITKVWHHATLALHGQSPCVVLGEGAGKGKQAHNGWILPLQVAGHTLGNLQVALPHAQTHTSPSEQAIALAQQCARMCLRLQSQQWLVGQQHGSAPCLLGYSPAMLQLDEAIAQATSHGLPVLLRGTGLHEAQQTVAAIHYATGHYRPWVVIDAAAALDAPARWVARARGGSLLVHGMHRLATLADQAHVWEQLMHASAAGAFRLFLMLPDEPTIPSQRAEQLAPWPLADDNWCSITLPTLTQRSMDIPLLTRAVLDYYGHHADQRLTDTLQQWSTHYHWPGQAQQLEQVLARMAVLTPGTSIGAQEINQHAPQLLGGSTSDIAVALTDVSTVLLPAGGSTPADPSRYWVLCVVEQRQQALGRLHPALARALSYLFTHWRDTFPMEHLAAQAYVSPSHLRQLLREEVGLSFKLFVQAVRIEHARRMLEENPHARLADIAEKVGFSDRGHFRQCLRNTVGA